MNRILKKVLILFVLVVVLVLPYLVFAADTNPALKRLEAVGTYGGYDADTNETSFAGQIGTVVSAFLSLLGIIFVGLMIYAGYHWMTAAGNEDKIKKSKEIMQAAVIGLIIVVSSYAIWQFIAPFLLN